MQSPRGVLFLRRGRGEVLPLFRAAPILLAAAFLPSLAGCGPTRFHPTPTRAEIDRVRADARRIGETEIVSVRCAPPSAIGPPPAIRIGVLMRDLTETTPGREVGRRIRRIANRCRKVFRRVRPSRDLHFDVLSPLDGLTFWATVRSEDPSSLNLREVIGIPDETDGGLFHDAVPLPPHLRRGFYLPFVGLPDVAFSRGAREAALLDLSPAGARRLRPHLEALAGGAEGNPREVRMDGLVVNVRSAATGGVIRTYPLDGFPQAKSLALSPDGRSIALLGRRREGAAIGPWRVFLLDRASGAIRPIFTVPGERGERALNSLGWSADGGLLALAMEGLPARYGADGVNFAEWFAADRTIVLAPDGRVVARIHGRCPSWRPDGRGLLLIRDEIRTLLPPDDPWNRPRSRWIHRIVEAPIGSGGKGLRPEPSAREIDRGETEGWVFAPPVWLPEAGAYLTVESAAPGDGYGWRGSGRVARRSLNGDPPRYLGRARLIGSPDGSALILRAGRLWRLRTSSPADQPLSRGR